MRTASSEWTSSALARAAGAALFSFLLLSAGAASAQVAVKPVARPEVKADDRWIYRRWDYRAKPPVHLYELQVSFVDARAIHTVLVRQGKRRESDATWTPEWNGVVSVDDGVVEVDQGLEVPAGRFRALKIEASGVWRRLDKQTSGWARNTVWYVPQAKRWVKTLYEDAQGKVGEELVFYVVQ